MVAFALPTEHLPYKIHLFLTVFFTSYVPISTANLLVKTYAYPADQCWQTTRINLYHIFHSTPVASHLPRNTGAYAKITKSDIVYIQKTQFHLMKQP